MPKANNELLSLHEVVQSSISLFDFSTEGIYFEYSDDQVTRRIFADRQQMIRIFSNLVKNAVQGIDQESDGLIRFQITSKDKNHLIEISDNGKGIPQELQPRIFTPYFTTKTSGMGLGLAIVKSIVESMGGSIRFESEEGRGTKFFVVLPAAR
jgi:signal transduction histidine kinase